MIVPSSYEMALLLGLLALICGALWTATYKLGGDWRFELYYFDFAFGTIVAALLAGLTFGSMGNDLSFWDNISLTAGKRAIVTAFAAGCLFNLANLLILAGSSIGGISLAFPASFSIALLVESVWALLSHRSVNFVFLGIGWLLLLIAVGLCVSAANRVTPTVETEIVTKTEAVPSAQPGGPKYYRRRREEKKDAGDQAQMWKTVLFASLGGLLLGFVPGVGQLARAADIGLGSYSFVFIFCLGIFISTFVFNLYFMNLPVQGPAVQFFRYFQGGWKEHALGMLGGLLFACGALAALLMGSAPSAESPSSLVQYVLTHGAPLLVAGLGIVVWKELSESPPARGMAGIAAIIYTVAVALVGSSGQN
ncbi:MAG: hypothetical protein K2X03_00470 [Bryobacteraceae bacterium]|nr:hypothetical protein [Bryobacteraceae bacterium]